MTMYTASAVFASGTDGGQLIFGVPGQVPEELLAILKAFYKGDPGPSGSIAGSYQFAQPTPSDTWTVNHNLGFTPNVTILNSGGREVLADVLHTSVNQFIVYFDSPATGLATYS